MVQRFFAWLYRVYLRSLYIGATLQHGAAHASFAGATTLDARSERTLEELDVEATHLGEAYRGIGILVALVGAAIIFLALVPLALSLPQPWPESAKATKLALMVAVVLLLAFTWRTRLQQRWIEARLRAEHARYRPLALAIEATADGGAGSDEAFVRLSEEMKRVLTDSKEGQIRYNENRRNAYAGIEHFAKRLTYLAFVAAFGFALLSMLPVSQPWFVFVTVFLPALIGTMHGLNGFLRLHQLEAEHGELAIKLQHLYDGLPSDLGSAETRERLRTSASRLLNLLSRGNTTWTSIAVRQEMTPP